jgi:exopolyphosphatase
MVSALGLAYLEQLKSDTIKYIPLLNIPRDDLSLRGDIVWAFNRFGVDNTNLVFISDLDLEKDSSSIILVDHNALASSQLFLNSRIIGIYDHHKDENNFLTVLPRVIEPIGSCCSLIVSQWMQSNLMQYLSPDIAMLLLSAVLIDTINLEESFGRTKDKDKEVDFRFSTEK